MAFRVFNNIIHVQPVFTAMLPLVSVMNKNCSRYVTRNCLSTFVQDCSCIRIILSVNGGLVSKRG